MGDHATLDACLATCPRMKQSSREHDLDRRSALGVCMAWKGIVATLDACCARSRAKRCRRPHVVELHASTRVSHSWCRRGVTEQLRKVSIQPMLGRILDEAEP
mmetsp:Transcript_131530/g.420777  ORF Transcript_131530/g.420777 Transcript_131530/m.420777 type:complete len:103 (-) Transcript_131530:237-545(-)